MNTPLAWSFPNTTNKIEVERQQFELLQYLRKAVNNFSITLDINVNETLEKKYVYTPEDKYEKLVEKNKHVKLLRKTFDFRYIVYARIKITFRPKMG